MSNRRRQAARSSSREDRISWYQLSVVYFSRGTLPQKRVRGRAMAGGPRQTKAKEASCRRGERGGSAGCFADWVRLSGCACNAP